MRHSKESAIPDDAPARRLGVRQVVIGVCAVAIAGWAAVAFAQEAYLSHKLSQQASALRQQNSLIAAENQAYQKDVQGITSGAADEEEERLNGYSKPGERVYLVSSPPPSPSPSPSPKPSQSATPATSPSPRQSP